MVRRKFDILHLFQLTTEQHISCDVNKDWGAKKVTIYFPIFYLVTLKVQKMFYSFTCILSDYVAYEIVKAF